jgi:cathepsin C
MKLIKSSKQNYFFLFTYLFFIIINIEKTLCDLPIHCLKEQIVGKWKIIATDLYDVKNGHEMKCGHTEPSTEKTAWRAETNLSFSREFELTFHEDDKVILSKFNFAELNGNWTMIYDEGFDINFHNLTFFAFNKYTRERNKEFSNIMNYNSLCYSTCLGWYRENKKWGCFKAYKIGADNNLILHVNKKNISEEEFQFVDPKFRTPSQEISSFKTLISSIYFPDEMRNIKIDNLYIESLNNLIL